MLFISEVYSSCFCVRTNHKLNHKSYNLLSREEASFPRQREKAASREKQYSWRLPRRCRRHHSCLKYSFHPRLIPAVQSDNVEFNFSNWKYSSAFLPHFVLTERKRGCKKFQLSTENFRSFYQRFQLGVFSHEKIYSQQKYGFKTYLHFIILYFPLLKAITSV